ncbi:MAG: hypothetical protein GY927_19970 [bacterium]|nr:hypothetical protein [bacterium]
MLQDVTLTLELYDVLEDTLERAAFEVRDRYAEVADSLWEQFKEEMEPLSELVKEHQNVMNNDV